MKLEIRWISMRAAFRIGLLFHLVTHSILTMCAFIALSPPYPLSSALLWVLLSAFVSALLWLFGAAAFNLVSALSGGLTVYLAKMPTATRQSKASPYSTLAKETQQRRAEREASEARAREKAKQNLTEAEIAERRKWSDREYRVYRYNRLQQRRKEIRDE